MTSFCLFAFQEGSLFALSFGYAKHHIFMWVPLGYDLSPWSVKSGQLSLLRRPYKSRPEISSDGLLTLTSFQSHGRQLSVRQ